MLSTYRVRATSCLFSIFYVLQAWGLYLPNVLCKVVKSSTLMFWDVWNILPRLCWTKNLETQVSTFLFIHSMLHNHNLVLRKKGIKSIQSILGQLAPLPEASKETVPPRSIPFQECERFSFYCKWRIVHQLNLETCGFVLPQLACTHLRAQTFYRRSYGDSFPQHNHFSWKEEYPVVAFLFFWNGKGVDTFFSYCLWYFLGALFWALSLPWFIKIVDGLFSLLYLKQLFNLPLLSMWWGWLKENIN